MHRKQIFILSTLSVLILSCLCPMTNIAEQISDQFAPQEPFEIVEQLPSETPVPEELVLDPLPDTLIYRANLERTGVYQSAGPKTSPKLLWKFNTEGVISDSSPVVYRRIAYIGSEIGLYAVDIQTGQSLWIYQTKGSVHTSPSIEDGIIYFGSEDGLLHALDCLTGDQLWTFVTGGEIRSSPILFEGMLYFGSDDGFFYALDALTGQETWRFEVAGNVDSFAGFYKAVRAAPAISNGSVLFGNTKIGGASAELKFYALDTRTGEVHWEFDPWNLTSSPAVEDGVVYFGGFMSFLGLDLESGSPVFSFGTDWGISPPAILDGIAYFGCDNGYLHALDLQTNEEIWVFESGRSVTIDTAPSIADGVVYAGSGDGFLYAVDLRTGHLLWEFETGGWISSSPVIVDGVIYFGSADGYLYALE